MSKNANLSVFGEKEGLSIPGRLLKCVTVNMVKKNQETQKYSNIPQG